jgi:hypothetical protein
MPAGDYFRGGNSLKPRARDVKIDKATALVQPLRGVSVYNRPDNLEKFGGAHRVTNVPAELQIVQRGQDPTHFEIVPVRPITWAEYEEALNKIVLVPV